MKHIVPAKTYDLLDAYVAGKKKAPKGDILYDAEVESRNKGFRFLIQVCGCTDDTPYLQVVVLDADGYEVGCLTDCDSFGGYYVIGVSPHKKVTLEIVRAKPKACKKTITYSELRRLEFCNSPKLPQRVVHDGVVKQWVGVGWVTHENEKPKPNDVYVVED